MDSDSEGEVKQESYDEEEDDGDDVGYHSGGTGARSFTESEAEIDTPRNKQNSRRPSKSSEKENDEESPVSKRKQARNSNSTLGEVLRKGRTLGHCLKPSMTPTCIFFKDAKPKKADTLIKITVTLVRGLPLTKEANILSRRIRVCLFDPEQRNPYLSNVYEISAQWETVSPNQWKLSPHTFYIQTNNKNRSLSLLFELGLVYKASLETNRNENESPFGWCIVPLWKPNTLQQEIGSFDCPLRGGNHFDKEYTPLDPVHGGSIPQVVKKGLFQSNKWQGPTLSIEFGGITDKTHLMQLNNLPKNILISPLVLELVCAFRELIVTEFPLGQATTQSRCEPIAASFLKIIDFPDLAEGLRNIWTQKRAAPENKFQRDLTTILTKTVLQVSPLLHLANMPAQMLGDEQATKTRLDFIKQFLAESPEENIVKNKQNYFFEPFTLEEVSLDPIL